MVELAWLGWVAGFELKHYTTLIICTYKVKEVRYIKIMRWQLRSILFQFLGTAFDQQVCLGAISTDCCVTIKQLKNSREGRRVTRMF